MNRCIIESHSSFPREYEVQTKSALKCAKEFGRCEGGEIVRVYAPRGKLISEARWTQEDGGRYYRAAI